MVENFNTQYCETASSNAMFIVSHIWTIFIISVFITNKIRLFKNILILEGGAPFAHAPADISFPDNSRSYLLFGTLWS